VVGEHAKRKRPEKGKHNADSHQHEGQAVAEETKRDDYQTSGMGANSPGHPDAGVKFIKIPSDPFTGRPRSAIFCSLNQTGISFAFSGGTW